MSTRVITDVSLARETLLTGNLCAIPTETVYGLAADADNPQAVARVFEMKGRPQDHPLIVHISDFESVSHWITSLPEWAIVLATACWPGPLTLVGYRTKSARDDITGGQDTVAVRIPHHNLTLQLLADLKSHGCHGLVAPSANLFGHVSPTTAHHVVTDLGNRLSPSDAILDGGPCSIGIESTIVLATGDQPVILRPGAITQSDIERITGVTVIEVDTVPRISGSLASHYAPAAHVRLVAEGELHAMEPGAGLLALDNVPTPAGSCRLASPASVQQFAACLYSSLRAGDDEGLSIIYVVPPHSTQLADAISDRLKRAASDRKENTE